MRRAIVKGRGLTFTQLERYLPSNYAIVKESGDVLPTSDSWMEFTIEGEDNAGWTLDGYVIPRLASGLIFAEEIK
jgi:hypothetical protein